MVDETENNDEIEEQGEAEPSIPPEEVEARVPSEREKLTAERNKFRDQLLRTAANFDNFRKRSRRDLEDATRQAREDVLRELLPVIDNLERASHAMNGATEVEAVVEGVNMVLRGFEDTANRLQLKRVNAVGERFDPGMHDAMQQQETDEHPPGTIVAEIVPGYTLADRLLRPAMVVVARPPAAEETNEPETANSDAPAEANSLPTSEGEDTPAAENEEGNEPS